MIEAPSCVENLGGSAVLALVEDSDIGVADVIAVLLHAAHSHPITDAQAARIRDSV